MRALATQFASIFLDVTVALLVSSSNPAWTFISRRADAPIEE